ncbi:acetylglutamate kinase [Spirochaeta cellobiosiphila]|uniref:acetylglutamate kinase n=1 Tax=Spirochaeta cellobiosiphila TaxID=504483 RepID=UPI00040E1A1D|nr:acetylglutamate kinase [Spirochaeta cellobiosiphila]
MTETIVIKMGGQAVSNQNQLEQCLKEISLISGTYKIILVHGGGHEISSFSKKLGIEPYFKEGIRMTSKEEMTLVDMVLGGSFNKLLVRKAQLNHLKAVGISGSDGPIFQGHALGSGNYTGRIDHVDISLIKHLLSGGYFPILAPPSIDEEGNPLNINADEAALALATAIKASHLLFISDIPGILNDGVLIPSMTPMAINTAIKDKIIIGGMIPKVQSAIKGLEEGIGQVVIGQYTHENSLLNLIEGSEGTQIHLEH